ncbi:hypothetical protein [Streptomyces sp. NPDC020141]|uniref:hypothetical protein n=1 Tax=Streptomyces sp. NPDC020141 TaxID=3365065 RepID=UPI0037A253ED
METRDLDLTHADHTQHFPHPSPAPPTAGVPVAGLPYEGEGLRPIWDLFPDAHPHARTSPANQPPAHNTALLLAPDDYLARVHDLVRREEALAHLAAHRERVLTPMPVPTLLPTPAAPQRVPAFVWKYSALALSTGGGIALAGVGVGAAAPGLAALEGLLAAAGKVVMSAAVLIVLLGLVLTGRSTARGSGAAGTTVNIRKAVFRRNKFHG